jgi:hexulose-6-phosphate isomerase
MQPIDRRLFLGMSGALALAASLGAQDKQTPPRKRALKKAVGWDMIGAGKTAGAKLALIKQLGFDGVELPSPSDLNLDEIAAGLKANSLGVSELVGSHHWSEPLSDGDAAVRAKGLAALETGLRDCKKIGASSLLVVPAVVNANVSYDQAWERSLAELKKLVPLAKELEVHITIENVWNGFLLSPLEAARYVDALESDWVGWHFDVGNVINFGWPEQWIRILGKRIKKLHIKEFSRKKRNDEGLWKGFDVKLGDGDNNWPAVMAALDEVGYSGWGTAEVSGGGEDELRDVAARMDRIFAS